MSTSTVRVVLVLRPLTVAVTVMTPPTLPATLRTPLASTVPMLGLSIDQDTDEGVDPSFIVSTNEIVLDVPDTVMVSPLDVLSLPSRAGSAPPLPPTAITGAPPIPPFGLPP